MLSLKDIMTILNVSYDTARRLVVSGALPAINVTPNSSQAIYRIHRDDLDKFMQARQVVQSATL
jgi:excisionase family DNA binding protein